MPTSKKVTRVNKLVLTMYANDVAVRFNTWDFEFIFGQIKSIKEKEMTVESKVWMQVSPQTAKALVEMLVAQVLKYEQVFGPINITPKENE